MIQRELVTIATLARQAQMNCQQAQQALDDMRKAYEESYKRAAAAIDAALEALNKL